MQANNPHPIFPPFVVVPLIAVLSVLYFGLLLPDWHYIEDIRAMVVPSTLFGIFSGVLLSAAPLVRNARHPCKARGCSSPDS